MQNKWMKRFFPFVVFFLLLPWPVAYAVGAGDPAGEDAVRIELAEASAMPSYSVFGMAIGGVSNPGDLFYIDATSNPSEIKVTLYLTNTQQLLSCYRYLILDVGIYVENGQGEWERAIASNGELIPKTIISMRNGQVSFLLPGYARYRMTIDSGCFYCTNASVDSYSRSPQFYLEVI